MNSERNIVEFYMLCNKLKDVVRTGWKVWGVKRQRVESIAEHIYGVQMLAIAMWSEYKYDLDIKKVVTMLAVHEMEEIIIGDIICIQKPNEEKQNLGHEAVVEIFKKLSNAEDIKDLIFEFDERKTPEAKFAYFCDKLEADIQSKLYDEENCVDINHQEDNKIAQSEFFKKMLDSGATWSDSWITFSQQKYQYDENFLSVSEFVKNNKI